MVSTSCPHCGAARSEPASQEDTCRYCGNPFIAASAAEPGFKAEIRDLLRRGDRIEAVRRVRIHTDLSLKEAKDIVDELDLGRRDDDEVDLHEPAFMAEVRQELARGRKINAIKHFREQTNLGLKEAKEAVDALERGERVELRRRLATASSPKPMAKPFASLGCLRSLIFMSLVILVILTGCSLAIQSGDKFKCTVAAIESNPGLRESLGPSLKVSPIVLFPEYSSESGFGWQETHFNYVTLLSGSRETVLLQVGSFSTTGQGQHMKARILQDFSWNLVMPMQPVECPSE